MLNSQIILADLRFWAVLYGEMLGQVSEPVDSDIIYSLLSVDNKDANDWFVDLMGWAAGEDDDKVPEIVFVPLAPGLELAVEFELGDVSWHIRDPVRGDARLGSLGGHWELPGLRWEEAKRMANASPDHQSVITLLLLPIVWLTDGDEPQAIRSAVVNAWIESGLVPAAAASVLADAWLQAVDGGRAYGWRRSGCGWICEAQWSTRGEQRDATEIEQINQIIAVAAGGSA